MCMISSVRSRLPFSTSSEAVHCRNQDLSVFFTSISTAQFQRAWMLTREFYRQRHGVELNTIYTVDLKEQQPSRVFRGRRRQRATKQFRIHSEDIPTIIFHSLQLQFFTVAGRGFVRIHGSPMGSPLLRQGMVRWGHPSPLHFAAWSFLPMRRFGVAPFYNPVRT